MIINYNPNWTYRTVLNSFMRAYSVQVWSEAKQSWMHIAWQK